MKPIDPRPRTETSAHPVVVVDAIDFEQLLISRRKLERRWDKPTQLVDLETNEIYVSREESESRFAQSA
jgi:hypothetical protein